MIEFKVLAMKADMDELHTIFLLKKNVQADIIKTICHIQVHSSRNYIPTVKSPPNHTSLPSTAAIFLATHLMVVLQLSGYSIFHSGDTPIQLGLP